MTNLDNKPFADHTVRQTVKTTDTLLRHKSISIRNLKAMGWVGVSKGDFLDAFSEWLFTAGGRWWALVCPLGIVSLTKCSFIQTPHKWQTQCVSLLTRAASNILKMPQCRISRQDIIGIVRWRNISGGFLLQRWSRT